MILREFVNCVYYSLFLPWSWLKILAADDVSQHRKWYRVRCHVLNSSFDTLRRLAEPYDDQLSKCKNPSHHVHLGIAFGDVVLVGTNGLNPYGMVA